MTKLPILTAAAVAVLAATPALARRDDIIFFVRNACFVSRPPAADSDYATTWNCKAGVCPNDTYRSVWIADSVRPGTVIKLWDSPDGSGRDDWAEIVVRKLDPALMGRYRQGQGLCIGSFQQTVSGPTFAITYRRHNGLDGKVSRIQVRRAP